MCLYPKIIINRKYIPNKKNNYEAPPIKDNRVLYVPIACQKCMECRTKKAREWSVRLQEEIKTNKNGEFVTLTFSNQSISKLSQELKQLKNCTGYTLDNEIAKLATRRFLERWRRKYKKSLKHWLITELGHNGTENIHLHGILFKNTYKHETPGIKDQYLQQQLEDIKTIWGYGFVYIGDYVSNQTINYTVKYVHKIDEKHKEYTPKILCSPGIGANYTNRLDAKLNKYKPNETDEHYTTKEGTKLSLPIYYRNKIYSEEEKEKLWIEKLNKETRWILGQKISTKNGLEAYLLTLKYAQSKNKRLGYGDNTKDWDRIYYENQIRELKHLQRTGNIEKKRADTWEEEINRLYLRKK